MIEGNSLKSVEVLVPIRCSEFDVVCSMFLFPDCTARPAGVGSQNSPLQCCLKYFGNPTLTHNSRATAGPLRPTEPRSMSYLPLPRWPNGIQIATCQRDLAALLSLYSSG